MQCHELPAGGLELALELGGPRLQRSAALALGFELRLRRGHAPISLGELRLTTLLLALIEDLTRFDLRGGELRDQVLYVPGFILLRRSRRLAVSWRATSLTDAFEKPHV